STLFPYTTLFRSFHLVQLELQAQELHLLERAISNLGGALPHLGPSRAEIAFESAESRHHGPFRVPPPTPVSAATVGAGPLSAPCARVARDLDPAQVTASLPPWPLPRSWRLG